MRIRQVRGLVPAKNGEKIGVANPDNKKFFELNESYFLVWQLCDGKKSEDEVAEEFADYLEKNAAKKKKFDKAKIIAEAKDIIKRLLKFNLLE
jgi:primase-polymerase (primpol)-like protein